MTIDWWTLAFQAVNFLILAWLLQRFLYRPVIGILERRRRESDAALTRLDAAKRAAEEARAGFEAKRNELAAEREKLVQDARARLERERQDVLAATRREAEAMMATARRSLDDERDRIVADLFDRASGLAVDVAARLMHETGGADADARLFDGLIAHLQNVPESERKALLAQLVDGAALCVVTARPLTDAIAQDCRARLDAVLGDGVEFSFATDETLIAGAELRFPHATLRFTWRGALDDVRDTLART